MQNYQNQKEKDKTENNSIAPEKLSRRRIIRIQRKIIRQSVMCLLLCSLLANLTGCGGAGNRADPLSAGNPKDSEQNQRENHNPDNNNDFDASLNTGLSNAARSKRITLAGDGSDTTTILIYMCATDLESNGGFASQDMREIAAADFGEQVRVLLFTGGCRQWKNPDVSNKNNQIYEIRGGEMFLVGETERLLPMTSPRTLSYFIRWVGKQYDSDRYGLIFWDHGGGSVSGYGYDEVYPRAGSMALDSIALALRNGGMIFDFIGFDACLMAALETALVAEPYADYLVASEETEPGCGWHYTDWLNALGKDPSMSGLEIGKQIADDFIQECNRVAPHQQATLSVLDLTELSGIFPEVFRKFAQNTHDMIRNENYQVVAAARNQTKEFSSGSSIDQVDLIHLAENLNTKESQDLISVLRSMIKYNVTSDYIRNANGVSVYFPYAALSKVNRAAQTFEKIGVDSAYTDCIRSFASIEAAGQMIHGGNNTQINALFGILSDAITHATGETGSVVSSISSISAPSFSVGVSTKEMIADLLAAVLHNRSIPEAGLDEEAAAFLDTELLENSQSYLYQRQFDDTALVWSEKDAQQVLLLSEEQWSLLQNIELNVFVDDGGGYINLGLDNIFDFNEDGDLIGAYDRTWLSVNGQIIAYYMLSDESEDGSLKIRGYIPAQLNGQRVNLMVLFSDERPEGEILGAEICYDQNETETIARGLLDIQDGDVIDFICDYYDYDQNYQASYFLGAPLIVSGDLILGNIAMTNQDYIATYRLTDIYQNHYWTPAI